MESASAVREILLARGLEVHSAATIHDLTGWLMLCGETSILIVELPTIDSFRKGVLKAVRRLAPASAIVALAKAVTSDVLRDAAAAAVARVLPTDATPEEIAAAAELIAKGEAVAKEETE